jgi:hypothetical protein
MSTIRRASPRQSSAANGFDIAGRRLIQGLAADCTAGKEREVARLFTPSEVQALIPLLEMLFGRLLVARDRRNLLVKERPSASSSRQAEIDLDLQALFAEMRELAQKIAATGGEVKDFEQGLVDFPCQRGTEAVCLCWQYGEKRLAFWHTVEEGFGGRKPIETDDDDQQGSLLN